MKRATRKFSGWANEARAALTMEKFVFTSLKTPPNHKSCSLLF
jgi:hypothetical protein